MRVTHTPNVADIDLELVRGSCDHRKWEDNFKKTAADPVINDKDRTRTLDNIRQFLASIVGDTQAHM
jgi:hypothetical protein